MLVMLNVTDPCRVHTMTKAEGRREVIDPKGLLARDGHFVRAASVPSERQGFADKRTTNA